MNLDILEHSEILSVLISSPHVEAAPGSSFSLQCTICSPSGEKIEVSPPSRSELLHMTCKNKHGHLQRAVWERNGEKVNSSPETIITYRKPFLLKLSQRRVEEADLGEYSCVVTTRNSQTRGTFIVKSVPVPARYVILSYQSVSPRHAASLTPMVGRLASLL